MRLKIRRGNDRKTSFPPSTFWYFFKTWIFPKKFYRVFDLPLLRNAKKRHKEKKTRFCFTEKGKTVPTHLIQWLFARYQISYTSRSKSKKPPAPSGGPSAVFLAAPRKITTDQLTRDDRLLVYTGVPIDRLHSLGEWRGG
jgi:hypothetical protein